MCSLFCYNLFFLLAPSWSVCLFCCAIPSTVKRTKQSLLDCFPAALFSNVLRLQRMLFVLISINLLNTEEDLLLLSLASFFAADKIINLLPLPLAKRVLYVKKYERAKVHARYHRLKAPLNPTHLFVVVVIFVLLEFWYLSLCASTEKDRLNALACHTMLLNSLLTYATSCHCE